MSDANAKLEARRAAARERQRKRRAEDPEWAQQQRVACREAYRKRAEDPVYRQRKVEQHREWMERNSDDPEHAERLRAQKRASAARRYAADPEAKRLQHRCRNYDLTPERLESLRAAQRGRCAVCGEVPKPRKNGADGLNIDHRHDNGIVRGLLCNRCNTAAGVLDLDADYLRRLAEYVQRGASPDTHVVFVVAPGCPPLREVS